VRGRVLDRLVADEAHHRLEAQIVVARRPTPSLVMEIKAQGALGLVAELGGTTSHGVGRFGRSRAVFRELRPPALAVARSPTVLDAGRALRSRR